MEVSITSYHWCLPFFAFFCLFKRPWNLKDLDNATPAPEGTFHFWPCEIFGYFVDIHIGIVEESIQQGYCLLPPSSVACFAVTSPLKHKPLPSEGITVAFPSHLVSQKCSGHILTSTVCTRVYFGTPLGQSHSLALSTSPLWVCHVFFHCYSLKGNSVTLPSLPFPFLFP